MVLFHSYADVYLSFTRVVLSMRLSTLAFGAGSGLDLFLTNVLFLNRIVSLTKKKNLIQLLFILDNSK